jgi:hypothetical protein
LNWTESARSIPASGVSNSGLIAGDGVPDSGLIAGDGVPDSGGVGADIAGPEFVGVGSLPFIPLSACKSLHGMWSVTAEMRMGETFAGCIRKTRKPAISRNDRILLKSLSPEIRKIQCGALGWPMW